MLLSLVSPGSVGAQIIPDATLPNPSQVTSQVNVFTITGGTQQGGNLFHSFGEFSLPSEGVAFFNHPATVSNIITRVTGVNPSLLEGLLRTNGEANLFFLNPNGIQFGPQARLEIGGSFITSTAETILFADGTTFSATSPNPDPLLTIAVPIGLQMGSRPGNLLNQSRVTDDSGQIVGLQVNPGQTLGLIGHEITLQGGGLTASRGRIELGTPTTGIVSLDPTAGFSFNYGEISTFGDIQLTQGAILNTSGEGGGPIAITGGPLSLEEGSQILGVTTGNQPGEDLVITSDRLLLTEESLLSTSTLGEGRGGNIRLNVTERITLTGTGFNSFQQQFIGGGLAGTLNLETPGTRILSGSTGEGDAGEVTIQTPNLTLENGAVIFTPALNQGNGGNLNILETQQINLDGSGLITSAGVGTQGNSGNFTLDTETLRVINGGIVLTSTLGEGEGGLITVNASDSILFANAPPGSLVQTGFTSASLFGTGPAGNITINTPSLTLDSGGFISSSSGAIVQGTTLAVGGKGGDLTINASTLTVGGLSTDGRLPTSIRTRSLTPADAGNLTLNVDHLRVDTGANVSTSSFNLGDGGSLTVNATESIEVAGIGYSNLEQNVIIPALTGTLTPTDQISGLSAATAGLGEAGSILLNTPRLTLTEGAIIFTPTFGSGVGGDLTVHVSQQLDLNASILITAAAIGSSGEAGEIRINTPTLTVANGGLVASTTIGSGQGGDVTITATESINILNPPEVSLLNINGIAANTAIGTGTAGNLTINTPRLSVQEGGTVFTGSGFATGGFMLPSQGNGGTMVINASELVEVVNLSNPNSLSQISTGNFGIANAGNLTLSTPTLIINGNATVNVSSSGIGNAASLDIIAEEIRLDNGGQLTASTASGEGGNINLDLQNLLLLRNNSLISSEAGGTGNGGNIEIQSPFIVAIPTENSDLIANAFEGQGGNITLTASGVFGLQFRDALTPESDITVSSQFGSPGNVEIITPDVETRSSLRSLPTQLRDSTQDVALGCRNFVGNSFTITGRGGLPKNPTQLMRGQTLWRDWQDFALSSPGIQNPVIDPSAVSIPPAIVEANSWRINDKGQIELVAIIPRPVASVPLRCPD